MLDDFNKDPMNVKLPYFMGFSCMKDHDWCSNYKDVSNAIILTIGDTSQFEKWKDERYIMNRSEEYKRIKRKIK